MTADDPLPKENDKPDAPERGGLTRRRVGTTRRLVRLTFYILLLMIGCAVGGFLYFADEVASLQQPDNPKADAIVVLTGGFQRIDQAVDLLKAGAGERLLISGVHPATTGGQIRRNTQSSADLFNCCVDIGYDAIDTIGNANETANWIRDNGYRSILVVTNNYHMPRSLLELRRANPGIGFIPYPVINSDMKSTNWLKNPIVLKTIFLEYAKFSVASLRELFGATAESGLRTAHKPSSEQ